MDKDLPELLEVKEEPKKDAKIVYKNGTFYTVDSVTGEMSDYKSRGAAMRRRGSQEAFLLKK